MAIDPNQLPEDFQSFMQQQGQTAVGTDGQPLGPAPEQAPPPPPDPVQVVTDLIIKHAQSQTLNADVQALAILNLSSALKTLNEASQPAQTTEQIPAEAQLDLEHKKLDHEQLLQTTKLRHEMDLKEKDQEHKHALDREKLSLQAQQAEAKAKEAVINKAKAQK